MVIVVIGVRVKGSSEAKQLSNKNRSDLFNFALFASSLDPEKLKSITYNKQHHEQQIKLS